MEFSSRRIFDGETKASTSQSHDLSSAFAAVNLSGPDDNNEDTQTDFLDVLNVIVQYEVPSIDLTYIGVVNNRTSAPSTTGSSLEQPIDPTPLRYGYNLGSGYSARVIRHATSETVLEVGGDGVVVQAETVVALKKITARPSVGGASDSIVTAEAYQSILQEIKISRHPLFQRHENIAKLLYVGWEQQETFPLIALELAVFGTLEDVLTAPGEGPTYRQKLNLTIDIALGIAVLHHVNIVHGDLKPANILVQHHPQRQIVAQISDFGGSFEVASGHDAPSIGTTLWSAPEAVFGIRDIDWKRADVWTYGLIVASIWSHFPSEQKTKSSCYIDKIVSEYVHGNFRNARIQLLKTEPDTSPTSILARCRRTANIMDWVYAHSLSSINSTRKTIAEIIAGDLTPACVEANRSASLDFPQYVLPKTHNFKVWSEAYRARDKTYQKTVFTHFLKASTGLRIRLEDQTRSAPFQPERPTGELTDVSNDVSTPDLWNQSVIHLVETIDKVTDGLRKRSIPAYQVAVSYLLELGTELDETELVRWAYIAARGDHPHAIWTAPLIKASCGYQPVPQKFHLSCLVLGACIGSKPSLAVLEVTDRDLYDATRRVMRARRRPNFEIGSALSNFEDFVDAPLLDISKCDLMDAIKSHNVERARSLLQDTSLDLKNLFDETGRNPLHALTYLEDRETEDLASLCCKRGASLEHNAQEIEPTTLYLNRRPIEGSSLRWAAAKGMMCLFQDLLLLHEQNGIVIRDAVSIASHAAAFHHHIILGSLLEYQKTIPELFLYEEILRPDRDWHAYLHLLLTSALTTMDIFPLSRRLLHGISAPTAKITTLELLLEEGVDPLNAPKTTLPNGQRVSMGPSAVDLVLDIDDDQCFSVLALNIKSSYDEATILDAMSHSLQQCIVEDHLKCFKAVVKEFPQLINFAGELGTLTPLNMAARRPDPIYARILLEKGADVTVSNKNFSPLARAVVDGHLETADTIYEFCTDQQRQQTFGFNNVTGFTLMGRVMSVWGTRKKSQALISAMHWIHGKGGAYPTINRKGDPIWSQILTRRPSSSAEYARLDDRMLETLFDMYPNKVNTPDSGGMFPIHWASVNGHRKAVELLLERQVDIDAETIGGERGLVPGGLTAFTMIATRIEEPPPADVEKGGKVEIRRWRERAKDILQFLLSKGATVGRHPRRNDTFRSWKYLLHNTSYMTADGRDEDDEIEWKEDIWPQKLPKDDTSTKENQRNGGELIKPEAKRALQIILGGITKRDGEKLEIDEEDREDFKKYGQWLMHEVEFRREQFKKHGGLWDGCHSREIDPAWDKWHEPGARRRQDPTPMESASGSSCIVAS